MNLKLGDFCWVQDYKCIICENENAVGFLTENEVLASVECDNCACDMKQVDPPLEEGHE